MTVVLSALIGSAIVLIVNLCVFLRTLDKHYRIKTKLLEQEISKAEAQD